MFESWKGPLLIGAVELVEIPEDYLTLSETGKRNTLYRQAFRNILRGMMVIETPVGLRLERVNGRTQVFFLTWGHNPERLKSRIHSLSSTINAHLPKFKSNIHSQFSGYSVSTDVEGVSACLTGEPLVTEDNNLGLPKVDPMDAVGEVIQGIDNIIFQVFISPSKNNKRKVKSLEREYEHAMAHSQKVVSSPSFFSADSQQSTTKVNASAARKAERLNRQIQRMSSRINYNEEHPERILRIQEILREFGDISLEPNFRRGVYDVHISNQIGIIMINEGMTPGDKTIQNPGLPESYKNWSEEARGAYLEELICEDGNFSKKRGFSWYRNHALHDSNEQGKYDFKSVIVSEEIELIKEEGNQSKGLVPQYELSIGELERQYESDNPDRSKVAQSLRDAISKSPNNLIEDEKKIAESLGIRINLYPSSVKYYPRSGRVSVKYTATTESQDDTIRWGKMWPPNDERKRKQVEEWLVNDS